MKKLVILCLCMVGSLGMAKLSDKDSMKCIYSDKTTETAFQDLQAAYGLRLIEAKDLYRTMDKAKSCPQLKKDLQKLRKDTVAAMPGAPMKGLTGSAVAVPTGTAPAATPGAVGSGTTAGTYGFPDQGFGAPYAPPPVPQYPPQYPGGDFYAQPTDSYGYPVDEMDY